MSAPDSDGEELHKELLDAVTKRSAAVIADLSSQLRKMREDRDFWYRQCDERRATCRCPVTHHLKNCNHPRRK